MFRIDLSSKRARLALRFFTYGVMTVATIVLTSIAVLHAMGYRFNRNLLTFEQGGLVQLRSSPGGAQVTVDGKRQSFTTPGRANLPTGVHTVQMHLDGYRAWQKSIQLAPGQLLWLNYARLIPDTIDTAPVRTFDTLTGTAVSPDRRWILLHEQADQPRFVLADVGNISEPAYTTITIPDDQLTRKDGKLGRLTVLEWDLSSRYVLIRHDNGDVHEFIRLDRTRRNEAINISQIFRLNITQAQFAGSSANIVYARTGDVLRRLDIAGSSASAALVTGLTHFTVYGDDTVAFTARRETTPGDANSVRHVIGIFRDNTETIIRTESKDAQITIAYTEYFRHTYLAFTVGDGVVHILRDPIEGAKNATEFARYELGFQAAWLTFSNNGRMLVAGSDRSFTTYDLELDKQYIGTIAGDASIERAPQWLDDYYLWTNSDGRLRIFEFDGTNGHEITTTATGFGASLSQDGQAIFSISKDNAGRHVLQMSDLRVD